MSPHQTHHSMQLSQTNGENKQSSITYLRAYTYSVYAMFIEMNSWYRHQKHQQNESDPPRFYCEIHIIAAPPLPPACLVRIPGVKRSALFIYSTAGMPLIMVM